MDQSGVEVRPLREMTGRALFSEVFFDDARVADDAIIGGLDNGWAVANTTLANERAGLGGGGGGAGGGAFPGKKGGVLQVRVGDLRRAHVSAAACSRRTSGGAYGMLRVAGREARARPTTRASASSSPSSTRSTSSAG